MSGTVSEIEAPRKSWDVQRQEAIQQCLFRHLEKFGKEGCFVSDLWNLRLEQFTENNENVLGRYDIATTLSIFRRKGFVKIEGGFRVVLVFGIALVKYREWLSGRDK